ncbi:glycosyltransferase family 2 protein [Oryzomonas japonica]|nr:glycosyltransferase family 2 protein [Oryzomonas japonica]
MHKFSIITAVYNRAHLLQNVYQSIVKQSITDVEWIVVDDGSEDNCREVVKSFKSSFPIIYLHQKNAGKHAALNRGITKSNSFFTVIIDSDDVLYNDDTLETVWNLNNELNLKKMNCSSISGLCLDRKLEVIGNTFPLRKDNSFIVSDHINMRFNKNISGDKCEFFLTDVLKRYPFPLLKDEKFLTEAVVWNRIAHDYKTVYVNIPFKLVEYLQDGLSSKIDLLFTNNMRGYMLYFNEGSIRPFKIKLRLLHAMNYIKVAHHLGYSCLKIFIGANNKLFFLPALCLAIVRGKKSINI